MSLMPALVYAKAPRPAFAAGSQLRVPHDAAPVLHLLAPVEVDDAGVGVEVSEVLTTAGWSSTVPEELLVQDALGRDVVVRSAEHDPGPAHEHEAVAALHGLLVGVDGRLDASAAWS